MKHAQKVIIELLRMYRESSCLWDTRSPTYGHRAERDKACNRLLAKYREIAKDATVQEVKKKLANLRTNYRKEHKKVLLSRLEGEDPEYQPQLWYYEHLLFLNDVADYGQLGRLMSQSQSNTSFIKVELERSNSSPEPKRRKNVSSRDDDSKEECNFMSDNNDTDTGSDNYEDNNEAVNEDSDPIYDEADNSNKTENVMLISEGTSSYSKADKVAQAEAFGTLVSFQMRDLDKTQRTIAEKLISDVIFKARFKKLTVDSHVSI